MVGWRRALAYGLTEPTGAKTDVTTSLASETNHMHMENLDLELL